VPALKNELNCDNVMEVPRLEKIVLNMGVGKAVQDQKLLDEAVMCLRNISGQKPVVTRAKKAVSNFKIRQGNAIGCKVTLRGERMYEFFDRLVSIAIPRIRDFRGLSRRSFDGQGNYSMGIKEQIVFLEIDRDKISTITGLDVCICTSAKDDRKCLALLEAMGMPFRK
jgi:large subunit ribosomal protein L5